MKKNRLLQLVVGGAIVSMLSGCGTVPVKKFYMLNYLPASTRERLHEGPYPFTIRVRELDIEEAYNRPQIVYRQSPFELRYYVYRVWAVKPTRMITDLVHKHLLSANIVRSVVRRFDEGQNPEFELTGAIEALEEYDSEELWFAHLALRLTLTRISDGRLVYTRRFDLRKRVFRHEPEYVVKEMSSIMEYIMTQAIHDMDIKLAQEYGLKVAKETESLEAEPSGPKELPVDAPKSIQEVPQ